MQLCLSQWRRTAEFEREYVPITALFDLIPDADGYRWQFLPDPDEGFEAIGLNQVTVEGWWKNRTAVTTERAAQALRHTQLVWGSLRGTKGGRAPQVVIDAIDTTTYRIDGPSEVTTPLAQGLKDLIVIR